jgi:hypothetical protein
VKDKTNELGSNSKNKNIKYLYRVIIEFEKGYQPRTSERMTGAIYLHILTKF